MRSRKNIFHRDKSPAGSKTSESKSTPLVDTALDVSSLILTTLADIAQWAPLPHLQQASSLALGILNTVRGAHDNKESFRRLASDACGLVYTILCIQQDKSEESQELSPKLAGDLEGLVITLNSISDFAQTYAQRNMFQRIVSRNSDLGMIQDYRQRLKQALDLFGLQSSITIRETVMKIAASHEKLRSELRERDNREQETQDGESRSTQPSQQHDEGEIPSKTSPNASPPSPGSQNSSNYNFPPASSVTVIHGSYNQTGNVWNNSRSNSGNMMKVTTINSFNKNGGAGHYIWDGGQREDVYPSSFDRAYGSVETLPIRDIGRAHER